MSGLNNFSPLKFIDEKCDFVDLIESTGRPGYEENLKIAKMCAEKKAQGITAIMSVIVIIIMLLFIKSKNYKTASFLFLISCVVIPLIYIGNKMITIYYFKQDCNYLKASTENLSEEEYKSKKSEYVRQIISKKFTEDIVNDNKKNMTFNTSLLRI